MSKPRPAHAEEAMHEQRRIPAWLVLPGILAIVLVGVLAGQMMRPPEVQEGELPDGSPAAADWRPTPPPEGQTFSLAIDFGNGVRKEFAALAWTEGMTVLEALQAATRFRPGVAFSHQGAGESAFITSIDGLKNAGAGGGNWIYEVNGEKATQSSGVQTLQASDALLWRYAPPE